jgi:phage-related minor tail protein
MPVVVSDLVATLSVDISRLKPGLEQAKQAFEAMGGSARQSGSGLQQVTGFERALAAETARLTALMAGQSRTAADVAAKYTTLSAAEQAHLVALKQQSAATLAATAAAAKQAKALELEKVSLVEFGEATMKAGRALTELAVPFELIGVGAFEFGEKVKGAMNSIRAQTGATGPALEKLGDSFRQVAARVPQDMDTVGKAVATLAQRTHLTGQALTDASVQFLNLSRITGTEVNPLIVESTKIFAQWGIQTKDQKEALDQLNRAHEATGIGVEELQAKILQFGPALKLAGLSLQDSEAILGSFSQHGIDTQKVMAGLNTVLSKWAKEGIKDGHQALSNLLGAVQKAPSYFAALKVATDAGFMGRSAPAFVNAVRTQGFEYQKFLDIILNGKETINKAGQDTLTIGNEFKMLGTKIGLAALPLGEFIAKELHGLGTKIDEEIPKLKAFGDTFKNQKDGVKNGELALIAFIGLSGPTLLIIGKVVKSVGEIGLAFKGLGPFIEKAGAAVDAAFASRAAAAAASLAVLQIAAIVAVTGFITAYLTNFDGLTDRLKSGWKGLWGDLVELSRSSWDDILLDQVRGWDKIVEYAKAGAQRLGLIATPKLPAGSLSDSGGGGDLGAGAGFIGPPVPKGGPAKPGLRPGHGAPPTAGGGHKETPFEKEEASFLNELAGARERYAVLLAGEGNIAGQVAARFHLLSTAQREQLVNVLQHTKALEKHNAEQQKFHDALAAVNAEIKDLNTYSGVKQVMNKFPGINEAQARVLMNAQATRDRAMQAKQDSEDAERAIKDTFKGEKDAVDAAQRSYLSLYATRKFGANNRESLALETAQQKLIDQLSVWKKAEDALVQSQKAQEQFEQGQLGVLGQLQAAAKQVADRSAELHGKTQQNVAAMDLLNTAIGTGNPLFIQWAQTIKAASDANDVFAAKLKDDAKQQSAFEKAMRQTATFMNSEFDKAFKSLAKGGAKDFFKNMLADLDQFLIDWAAKIAQALFGAAGVDTGPGGQGSGSAKNATTGLLGGLAGLVGGLFGGGSGDIPVPDMLTGKAMGGDVLSGRPVLVGERGPEMFIPPTSGRIASNKEMQSQRGDTHIHFNITTPDVQSFRKSQRQIMSDAHLSAESHRLRSGG